MPLWCDTVEGDKNKNPPHAHTCAIFRHIFFYLFFRYCYFDSVSTHRVPLNIIWCLLIWCLKRHIEITCYQLSFLFRMVPRKKRAATQISSSTTIKRTSETETTGERKKILINRFDAKICCCVCVRVHLYSGDHIVNALIMGINSKASFFLK